MTDLKNNKRKTIRDYKDYGMELIIKGYGYFT